MKTIRIYFYRPAIDKHLLDNIISAHTFVWNWPKVWALRCAHVEFEVDGICYTSTMRGDENGVVKRLEGQVLYNPERWFYVQIDLPETPVRYTQVWMDIQVFDNQGYDMTAILSFLFPKRFHDKSKFICSEFVYSALRRLFVDVSEGDWPQRYSVLVQIDRFLMQTEGKQFPSPYRLALWLKKAGFRFYDYKTGKEIA